MVIDAIMRFISSYITDNPVLIRELRVFTRPKLFYRTIVIYLGVLLTGIFIIWPCLVSTAHPQSPGILTIYAWIQTIIVLLLTPAFTAISIENEYETGTIEQAAIAGLSSMQIIVGKVLAATAVLSLLITSGLPIIFGCIVFWIGGDWVNVIKVHLLYIALCFAVAAIVMVSSKPKKYRSGNVYIFYILPAILITKMFIWGMVLEIVCKLQGVTCHPWLMSLIPPTVIEYSIINIAGQTLSLLAVSIAFWLLIGITTICLRSSAMSYVRSSSVITSRIAIFCMFIFGFWLIAGDEAFNLVTPKPGMAFGAVPYLVIYFVLLIEPAKSLSLIYRETGNSEPKDFLQVFPKALKTILFTLLLTSISYIVAIISHILSMTHTATGHSPFDMTSRSRISTNGTFAWIAINWSAWFSLQ